MRYLCPVTMKTDRRRILSGPALHNLYRRAGCCLRTAVCMAVLSCLCACGHSSDRQADAEPDSASLAETEEKSDFTSEAWSWADSVTCSMSVRQRAGQCLMPSVYAVSDRTTMLKLRDYVADCHIGGILLLRGDSRGAAAITDSLRRWSRDVPPWIAIDAEWGLGMRLSDEQVYPRNFRLAKVADEEMMFDYGYEVGCRCREIGINMILGPVVDVGPITGVMGTRSFGPDPQIAASLGVAYAMGVEGAGVMSVAKHFPGHGSPEADSHNRVAVVKRDSADLRHIDLVPFDEYVAHGLSGVMAGYLSVPAVDPSGRPAAVSPAVLQDLLRDEMMFRGLILTDAINMGGARGYSAADALAAGADLVVAPTDTREALTEIERAIDEGTLTEAELNERCRRVLFYKYLFAGN